MILQIKYPLKIKKISTPKLPKNLLIRTSLNPKILLEWETKTNIMAIVLNMSIPKILPFKIELFKLKYLKALCLMRLPSAAQCSPYSFREQS